MNEAAEGKSEKSENALVVVAVGVIVIAAVVWALIPRSAVETTSSISGVQELMKQARNWHSAAESSAHGSPLIALIEVTRAATYVRAARAVASDADIEKECGVDIQTFVRQVETLESQVLGSVSESPALAPTIT